MSAAIHFDFNDLQTPAAVFQALSEDNQTELKEEIGQLLVDQTLWRFDQEQDPEGNRWIPSQRAEETGGKTLQFKGHLRDSITPALVLEGIEVGSNLVYAAIHQWGGIANDYTALDARTYLGLSEDNMEEVGELTLDYYRGLMQ